IPGELLEADAGILGSFTSSHGSSRRQGTAATAIGSAPRRKTAPTGAATYAKTLSEGFSAKKPDLLGYTVGDQVSHRKFGIGEVVSIADGGRDFEVAVRFSDGKIRKMFATFANLKKV
ncbi:MAG: ATP-dependent DNA helicase PcrA, partial [Lachnospiraceae bacterium]|nr:ATP-dependent DNA helicase PcrA [Lachnospiraceae bacterium]